MVEISRKYAGYQISDVSGAPEAQAELVSLLPVVTGFYVLEDLSVASMLTLNRRGVRPPAGFWSWRSRLDTVKHYYQMQLADLLYDYLYAAAFGEARHASSAAQQYIPEISGGKSRGETCRKAQKYAPEQALPVLRKLFYEGTWRSSYGGKKWGVIVDAALLYSSRPQSWAVFIDHAIDLSHNGGLAFDKGIFLTLYDHDAYLKVLDVKRDGSLLDRDGLPLPLPPVVKRLLDEATGMGLVTCSAHVQEAAPFAYTPVRYGTRVLSEPIPCTMCDCGKSKTCDMCDTCSECCHCWFCYGCEKNKDKEQHPSCSCCDYCEACCPCWYCANCHEIKSKDLQQCTLCDKCSDCCECVKCEDCGEPTDDYCGECLACDTCCDCDKIQECDLVWIGTQLTCSCARCVKCSKLLGMCTCHLCHGCQEHRPTLHTECGLCLTCCVCFDAPSVPACQVCGKDDTCCRCAVVEQLTMDVT